MLAYLTPRWRGSLWNFVTLRVKKTRMMTAYHDPSTSSNKCDDICIRLDTMPLLDRQTDGFAITVSRSACIAYDTTILLRTCNNHCHFCKLITRRLTRPNPCLCLECRNSTWRNRTHHRPITQLMSAYSRRRRCCRSCSSNSSCWQTRRVFTMYAARIRRRRAVPLVVIVVVTSSWRRRPATDVVRRLNLARRRPIHLSRVALAGDVCPLPVATWSTPPLSCLSNVNTKQTRR